MMHKPILVSGLVFCFAGHDDDARRTIREDLESQRRARLAQVINQRKVLGS